MRLLLICYLFFGALLVGCSSQANQSESEIQSETPSSVEETNTNPMSVSENNIKSIFDVTLPMLDGKEKSLKDYEGKVLVLMNVASKCGYTGQYKDWQAYYSAHAKDGIEILGFPANNFGGQEPGSNEEIATFCEANYGVSFPMFSKISVKGDDQHPLYQYLTSATGEKVGWNFNKFVVGKDGKVIKHFGSGVKSDDKDFLKTVADALAK